MTTGGGREADDWDVVLNEDFVRQGRSEATATERAERAARITREHERAQAWRSLSPNGALLQRDPTRRRGPALRTAGVALLLAAVVAVSWTFRGDLVSVTHGPGAMADEAAAATPAPAPEVTRNAEPLGTPAPAPEGNGGYRFMRTQDDRSQRPVAFDPCRKLHYVIRPDNAPGVGMVILRDALLELSRVTGLALVDDGLTAEMPADNRPERDVARYGDRWSPVLIAWSDPKESPDLAGYISGFAGGNPTHSGAPGSLRYVTGQVVLDAPDFRRILSRPGGRTDARGIILHELGHLAGLNHVADRRQLMFSESGHRGEYGDGDLRGLNALGRGTCFVG